MIPCAILCGGLGTRLAPLTDNLPKSLVEVAGKPFIWHQLDLLQDQGITDVVLCIGHYGGDILTVLNMLPVYKMKIFASQDGPTPLGTAGALRKALPLLGDEFFVLYGDSYLPGVDYRAVYEAFKASGKPALMTVKKNDDPRHKNNAHFSGSNLRYDKFDRNGLATHIDYGLEVFKAEVFGPEIYYLPPDLSDVCNWYAYAGQLAGYKVTTPMLGIGNHESLAELQAYMEKQKT